MNDLKEKIFLITGVANKKSVAYHTAKSLILQGAKIILTVQSNEHKTKTEKLFPDSPVIVCDVENKEHINDLYYNIAKHTESLDGILHSIAFANFDPERRLFHETKREDFLQATQISCFSLTEITNACLKLLNNNASIVTIGISNLKATSYGYLGPIKAMLETSVCYLAKSLSEVSNIRVNCVCAGPLKTSASAGIPKYIENFIYSEALTLRHKALETTEVANTITFLLSDSSSGINAENIIVDAGMSSNYFDQKIVESFAKDF